MLLTTIILLPLALAHPHLAPRRHRARAAAAAVTDRPLVERAGAAISNETRDEISAWRHSQEIAQTSSAVVIESQSGVQAVGTALTAVSSDAASATPTSAVQVSAQEQESEAASIAQESVVETVTSEEAPASSTEPAPVAAVTPSSSATESSADIASSSELSTRSSITHTTIVTASRSSTVVRVTASSSASASAAASNENDEPEKIAGLNKTTFIIIIVVASVVALLAAGWTVFRKWKLSPSRRFDEKMRPIDFSPDGDVYMEKTHQRSLSNSSAAMHRQDLVAELDSKHVEGVPDHDFTAGGNNMAGAGAYDHDVYNQDPYSHAEAYEYDAAYQYDRDRDPRGYAHAHDHDHDQPTQDTGAGYADLHRGNSIGSGSGHGHGQQYPVESFPIPDHYLNRPISGDVPYGTSHRY